LGNNDSFLSLNERDEDIRILTALGLSKYNPKHVTIKEPEMMVQDEFIMGGESIDKFVTNTY
jgi:hypothetical protein